MINDHQPPVTNNHQSHLDCHSAAATCSNGSFPGTTASTLVRMVVIMMMMMMIMVVMIMVFRQDEYF